MNQSAHQSMSDKASVGPFAAILTPHRSLGPRGFLLLMAGIGSVSFITGLYFYAIGAWPVMGFFGLDVALIYLAFKLNYRSGRQFELVELKDDELTVTQVAPSGKRAQWGFNPLWVRLDLLERNGGTSDLRLTSHGRELLLGRFLSDDERREFADALRRALSDYRSGQMQSPQS